MTNLPKTSFSTTRTEAFEPFAVRTVRADTETVFRQHLQEKHAEEPSREETTPTQSLKSTVEDADHPEGRDDDQAVVESDPTVQSQVVATDEAAETSDDEPVNVAELPVSVPTDEQIISEESQEQNLGSVDEQVEETDSVPVEESNNQGTEVELSDDAHLQPTVEDAPSPDDLDTAIANQDESNIEPADEPATSQVEDFEEPVKELPESEVKSDNGTSIEQIPAASETSETSESLEEEIVTKATVADEGEASVQTVSDDAGEDERETSRRDRKDTDNQDADEIKAPKVREADETGGSIRDEPTELRASTSGEEVDTKQPAKSEPPPTNAVGRAEPETLAKMFARTSVSRPTEEISSAQQNQLINRVARAFEAATARSDSTIRLRLHPPQLGSLRLEVQSEAGALTARLEVETSTARDLLLENLVVLREKLAAQDIRVESVNVDLLDARQHNQSGTEQSGFGRQSNKENQQPGRQKENGDDSSLATTTSSSTTGSELADGSIDITV